MRKLCAIMQTLLCYLPLPSSPKSSERSPAAWEGENFQKKKHTFIFFFLGVAGMVIFCDFKNWSSYKNAAYQFDPTFNKNILKTMVWFKDEQRTLSS